MNTCIKRSRDWLHSHPKITEWIWFVALWCGGLFAVMTAAYPIKWLIRTMG